MTPFLYETAKKIITENEKQLHKLCLIFPNKRTGFWFGKYLAEIPGKALRPPKMFEIGTFTRHITGYSDEDKLNLIFELYKVYKKKDKINTFSFDDFYRLGEIIISDFNEIDSWLIEPEQIFRNINDLKEIENVFDWLTEEQKEILKNFWANFTSEKQSKEKQMFLELWNILPTLYNEFTEILKQKKKGYTGLIYREISNLIDNLEIDTEKYEKYIFTGFYSLNKAELKLFDYFNKKKKAEFYWDTDVYYQNDKKQEAGDFLRKNFEYLKINPGKIPDNLSEHKNIKIYGVSSKTGQAKLTAGILNNKNINYEKDTAIVFAEEDMLFPVLSSVPEHIKKINITMGYPFKLTPLFGFIQKYLKIRINFEKNGKFYFKNTINLLKHQYILEYNTKLSEDITNKIINEKRHYETSGFFRKYNDPVLNLIFGYEKNETETVLKNLLDILFVFFDKKKSEKLKTETLLKNEYIYKAYKKINRFIEILRENDEKISLKTASDLLTGILRTEKVPFEGEISEGLQITGLMESRNLDFKNVIILGLNEGIIPEIKPPVSFISQSMRYAFGLPVIRHKDSVFAYLFYRLIQRAENISLIYNSITDETNSGEMSRFLLQLLHERNFDIEHKLLDDLISIQQKEATQTEKNEKTYKKLSKFFITEKNKNSKTISASALNTYIDCPLKFYFKYAAELSPPETAEEDLSPAEFGNILHSALDKIYSPLISDKEITKNDLIRLQKNITPCVNRAFKEHFNDKNYQPEGLHIIIKSVIEKYVKRVLDYDIKQAPFKIISTEKKYYAETEINIGNEKKKIRLFGITDRLDKKNGMIKIIDYKTGKPHDKISNISDLFDKENTRRKSHIFQSLFYTYILSEQSGFDNINYLQALYYVRDMNKPDFSADIKISFPEKPEEYLTEFKNELKNLLEEIFDKTGYFRQTEDIRKCDYCDFNKICR